MDMTELPWIKVALCSAGAGAFYLLSKSYHKAEALRLIPRIDQFKELPRTIDAASKAVPLVVTICGLVATDDSPIECKRSKLKGVIWEEDTYRHYKKLIVPEQNKSNASKEDSSESKEKVSKEDYAYAKTLRKYVPWYLNDETGHVRVDGPLGSVLSFASRFYESAKCNVCGSCLKCSDRPHCSDEYKFLGLKIIKSILPIGVSLTVIGEVTNDGSGLIRIQEPKIGPFIVSTKTIEELIEEPESLARFWMTAGNTLLLCGGLLIIKHVTTRIILYIKDKRRGSAKGSSGKSTVVVRL